MAGCEQGVSHYRVNHAADRVDTGSLQALLGWRRRSFLSWHARRPRAVPKYRIMPTSIRARRRPPSAPLLHRRSTKSARSTKAPRPMDWMAQEQERESRSPPQRPPAFGTTTASTSSDTPGMSTSRSRSSVACVCSTARCRVRLGRRWWEPHRRPYGAKPDKYGVPRICFVNKMDRIGADFPRCIAMIDDRLGAKPRSCSCPSGLRATFSYRGSRRVSRGQWHDETLGAEFDIVDVPPEIWKERGFRTKLVEAAVEQDDAALEALSRRRRAERRGVGNAASARARSAARLSRCCVAPPSEQGCPAAADAVVDYLPAPTDVAAINGIKVGSGEPVVRRCSDDEPFAGLAFKIMSDPLSDR